MKRPVALITGASSGIGAAYARKLAHFGFDLILVARRGERLESLARELPGEISVVPADLTTDAGLELAESAIRKCERLAILVNNAGFGTLGRFWQTDLAGQETMHRLHITATLRLTRAALEGMTARGRGSIINVSSVAAFAPSEGGVSYCATKAWMNRFTEGLAIELKAAGSPVHVQAVCPGFTVTEFHDVLGIDRRKIPSWLWMLPDEIVDASLKALEHDNVIVVPGWQYKIIVGIVSALPFSVRRHLTRPGRDKRV